MSRTYDHGTGKVNLGKLHASWMADETDCAVSERSEYMPSLESANKHMAGRSRTDHVGALLGSNIIHNTFMSSSAAGVVLCRPLSVHAFIDSRLETLEVLIEYVCPDLAQVQSVGFL